MFMFYDIYRYGIFDCLFNLINRFTIMFIKRVDKILVLGLRRKKYCIENFLRGRLI